MAVFPEGSNSTDPYNPYDYLPPEVAHMLKSARYEGAGLSDHACAVIALISELSQKYQAHAWEALSDEFQFPAAND